MKIPPPVADLYGNVSKSLRTEVTKGIIELKAKSMTLYPERNAEVQTTTATSAKEFKEAGFRTDVSPVIERQREHKAKAERATGLSAKEFKESDLLTDEIVFARSVTTKQSSPKNGRDCHENQRFSRNDAAVKTIAIDATKPTEAKQSGQNIVRDCHADKSARKDTVNRQLNIFATKKQAFTLAEVLITLVIIGIIAAITVPTLMANHQKQETAAKLKKFYSTLSNAVRLAQIENSNFVKDSLVSYSGTLSEEWWKGNLGKYMPVTKTNQTYTRNGSYGTGSGDEDYSQTVALNDGSLIIYTNKEGLGTISVFYDVNGYKGPNRHTKDIFKFTIQQYDWSDDKIHWTIVCTGDYCSGKNNNPIPQCQNYLFTSGACNKEWPGDCARYIQCNGWKL